MKHNNAFGVTDDLLARAQLRRLQGELDDLKERLGESDGATNLSLAASKTAQELIRKRRDRDRLFGSGLFSDPAWDILLELFVAHTMQQRLATSELGEATGTPSTTALRWIAQLEKVGLVARKPDPLDARRVFIGLTQNAYDALETYFGRKA